jgi:hypothetical protein
LGFESNFTATAALSPDSFSRFAQHLDSAWIEEALLATGAATIRRRRLPMDQVVRLVLGMGLMRDLPMTEILHRLDLALPDGEDRTVARSAIAQARARLGAAPLEWLFVRTSDEWGHDSAVRDKWRGLAMYAVDGSTLRVADSDENRRHFSGQVTHRGDSGYPQVRLVVLMAVRSHLLVAASFGPYGVDERTYAEDLWPSVPTDSLVLIDRAYLQANVLVPLVTGAKNRHWLTRAKANSKWKVTKRLGRGDAIVEMTVSSEARRKDSTLPRTFAARAIEYRRKGFAPQTLLTSLTDGVAYPADELRELYHERWEIEVGYDEIKTDMLAAGETIRSKSPEAVAQEIWGILLGYNLVRREAESVAAELGVPPLRISFIATLREVVSEWREAARTPSPGALPKRLASMRDRIRQFLLPERRSERSYPRAVKIKMSNYTRKRPKKRPLK